MLKRLLLFFIFLSFPFSAFSIHPDLKEQARAYREEGYRLQSMGKVEEALSLYIKAINMDPFYKEAYNDAGVVYESTGDLQKAEQMYLKAVDIDSSYPAPYANLGFLYEKLGQPKQAAFYWKKRIELGPSGDYWREKAWEHLQKLGSIYPEIRQGIMEEQAARLSRELVYKREQERLEVVEEAKLHFNLGFEAFTKGAYEEAAKEMLTVVDLNPADEKLLSDAKKYLKISQESNLRKNIQGYLENGLNYLEEKDYLSLMQELRKALAIVSEIPRE